MGNGNCLFPSVKPLPSLQITRLYSSLWLLLTGLVKQLLYSIVATEITLSERGVSGRFRSIPRDDDSDETVIIERFNVIMVGQPDRMLSICSKMPRREYDRYRYCIQLAQRRFTVWYAKRKDLIKEIEQIAKKCDDTQFGTNVAKLSGAGVGIAGAGFTIAGFFFPPCWLIGVPMLGAYATNGVVTGITKEAVLQSCASSVNELIKNERGLRDDAVESLKALQALLAADSNISSVENTNNGLQIATDVQSMLNGVMNVGANVLKCVTYATAGVGVSIDVALGAATIADMAKGSRSEAAAKIREVANALRNEAETLNEIFNRCIEELDR